MTTIRDGRVMPAAQVRFKTRHTAMMRDVAARVAGVLALAGERVPPERADDVMARAGEAVQAVFVVDGRKSVDHEGVPISPYARALMAEVYLVTVGIVNRHADYMDKALADAPDVRAALMGPSRRIGEQADRLFQPNPLAEYEPAHTWVDPNGYILSKRIWNTSIETRRKLDGLMADLIRQGVGSQEIARQVEQFLIPGRAKIRTNPYAPYGTDASYDAMRLARTEIARAHNQASWMSSYLNPYTEFVRMRRSPNGMRDCQICLAHAGPVGGEGIRYPVIGAIVPPNHPHCVTPGQLIDTKNGLMPIEDIRPGDFVMTDKGRYRLVIDSWSRSYSGDVYTITTGSGKFRLTSEHPVLTSDGWVNAEAIKPGQNILYTGIGIGSDLTAGISKSMPSELEKESVSAFISSDRFRQAMPEIAITLNGNTTHRQHKIKLIPVDGIFADINNTGSVKCLCHEIFNVCRYTTSAVLMNLAKSCRNTGVVYLFGSRNLGFDLWALRWVVLAIHINLFVYFLENPASYFRSFAVVPIPLQFDRLTTGSNRYPHLTKDVSEFSVAKLSYLAKLVVGHGLVDVKFMDDVFNRSTHLFFNTQNMPLHHSQVVQFNVIVDRLLKMLSANGAFVHGNLLSLSPDYESGHVSGNTLVGQVANPSQAHLYYSTVIASDKKNYDGLVYNMSVDEDNTYTVNGAVVHNCMCRLDGEVTRSPESVTAELRAFLNGGEGLPLLTPIQRDAFVEMLLGRGLVSMVRQLVFQLDMGI